MYYVGMYMPPRERSLLAVSGRLKNIVKHRTLLVGKRVSCAEKTGGPILTICVLYDVFAQGVAFSNHDDCTCIKFLVALFLIHS